MVNNLYKFYTMDHRGGLDEALKTRKEISLSEFVSLLPKYKYYCFDERLNCDRYILEHLDKNYRYYSCWLLVEEVYREK